MPKQICCFICGKENLTRNVIGLNKKMIGSSIKVFHCMDCLAEHLELSAEELEERIQTFKDSGCELFE